MSGFDLESYRTELRSYLASTPEFDRWRRTRPGTVEDEMAEHAALVRRLYEGGWSRYGWPDSAGGLGGDERYRAILYDELSACGLPVPEQHKVLETLGPPLVAFAPELAAEFLPAYLRGDEWWGQGFSEPEAGSDLAALRCRAEPTADGYVVTGQKLWTSHGATARRLVCLVRTGSTESRHRGLSMLLIDTDAPGLEVRPLALASGRRELAEVFFDGVQVPASRLIGTENQGWAVAMYLLQFERAMYAWLVSTMLLRRLTELRAQLPGPGPRRDGSAYRFGETYLDVIALRARSAATVQRLARAETVGPEASVDKVLLATADQGVYDTARDLLAPSLEIGHGAEIDTWRAGWWYSRSATILGGTAEMQRGILADHVLGLPKG